MNTNKMMTPQNTKIFWLVGIGIEIGLSIYSFVPTIFRNFPGNGISRPGYFTVWTIYTALILIAMKIISNISKDNKIFNYSLAIFIITLIWDLIRMPISHFMVRIQPTSQQGILNMFNKSLLFESIPNWAVMLTVAILYFLVLYRISVFLKDSRFKLSGVIQLIAVSIDVVYGPINFAMAIQPYISTKPVMNANILSKISSSVWAASGLLRVIALVILIIAVFQMDSLSYEEAEENDKIQL